MKNDVIGDVITIEKKLRERERKLEKEKREWKRVKEERGEASNS